MDIEEEYELQSSFKASKGTSYELRGEYSSNSFDLVYESCGYCSICYNPFSTLLNCSCNIKYCENCLREYFITKIINFECYNARCPNQTCSKSTSKLAKVALHPDEYKKFRKYSKKIKCLADNTLKFCVRPDCRGVGKTGKKSLFCNKCKCEFTETVDPGRYEILQKLNVVECPDCGLLISISFGCLVTSCLCGLEFCSKCKASPLDNHSEWKCSLKNRSGRISWLFIILLLYFPLIFLFSPAFLVLGYYWHWDRNYFRFLNSRPIFKFTLLFVLSPIIFIIGLFLFPLWLAWLCMDSLFDNQGIYEQRNWSLGLKIFFFFPSILPCFLGFLLLVSLIICFSPLFGIVLLVGKIIKPKEF